MNIHFKPTMRIVALMFVLVLFGYGSKAQCKAPDEKQVTNIEQVKDFMTFTHRSPVKNENNQVIGFHYSQSVSKGHRRIDTHCCFQRGFCGLFTALDLAVDLDGNIVKANFTIFIGTTPEGTYVRFEGLDPGKDD